jgi:surfeit locus 1 family protein
MPLSNATTGAAGRGTGDRAVERQAPPSRTRIVVAVLLGLFGVAVFMALGIWQVERRAWKLDLIERVDRRIHAAPVAAPGPAAWPAVDADSSEYERVRIAGHYLNDQEALVQAVTDLGGGFWVVTPFRADDGFIVLVNRGFVPPERRLAETRAAGEIAGETRVEGLLRLTEPKGGFLRKNDPAQDRWYSRDVTAIAAARGLTDVAPYFIDADEIRNNAEAPHGGLTVIAFPNNHLVYALTWFGLAAMVAGATIYLVRDSRRARQANP